MYFTPYMLQEKWNIMYGVVQEEENTKLKDWLVWSSLCFHIKVRIAPVCGDGTAVKTVSLQQIPWRYFVSFCCSISSRITLWILWVLLGNHQKCVWWCYPQNNHTTASRSQTRILQVRGRQIFFKVLDLKSFTFHR